MVDTSKRWIRVGTTVPQLRALDPSGRRQTSTDTVQDRILEYMQELHTYHIQVARVSARIYAGYNARIYTTYNVPDNTSEFMPARMPEYLPG